MDRAERYRATRDASIVIDEAIGGTPVIRGTRMTVYSVLGRVEHGDTIDDLWIFICPAGLGDESIYVPIPERRREMIESVLTA